MPDINKEGTMLTVAEVAKKYRVKTRQVLYAVRRNLLAGEKYGWVWLFPKSTLPEKWPVRKQKFKRLKGRVDG